MAIWTDNFMSKPTDGQQAALDFIRSVEATEPQFDFASYASDLVGLPELHTQLVELAEPSTAAFNFLHRLHLLMNTSPMEGLKVLTILCCNEQCASYPKSFADKLYALMTECLEVSNPNRRAALEWGIHCWRNWSRSHYARSPMALVPSLLRMLVGEAQVDPEYALETFIALDTRRTDYGFVFNQFSEDAWDVTQLGRAVRHLEPRILSDSLRKFLWNARHAFNDYQPGEDKIRRGANDLHDIMRSKFKTSPQDCEVLLNCLVLYALSDEPWYFELHELLWRIQLQKTEHSDGWLKNLALIAINCGSNSQLRLLAEDAFRDWAYDFTGIDRDPKFSVIKGTKAQETGVPNLWWFYDEGEPLERHAKSLIEAVSGALHAQFPQTRNRSFGASEHCGIADHAVAAYWEMVDWLRGADKRLYFQVLVKGIEDASFPTKETGTLAQQATQRLVAEFDEFCRTNLEEGAELVAFMISRSGYTDIGARLSKVLDLIYPILKGHDKLEAQSAVTIGHRFQQRHRNLWRPRLK